MYPANNALKRLLTTTGSIFLSSTLRIFLVLLLLVSCYTCIAVIPFILPRYNVIITVVVINVWLVVHHWYAMTKQNILKEKPRFGSLVDFILTAVECTTVLRVLSPWNKWPTLSRYDTSGYIIILCATYVLAVCLCILLMIRFAVIATQVIEKPSAAVTKPFDFFAMTNESSKPDIYGLVSGFSVGHDRHWFVFFLRRIFTVAIVLSLLAFTFTCLVLQPVQETGMTPQKLYTTAVFNDPDKTPFWQEANWSIIAFASSFTVGQGSELHDAIQVKALWNNERDTTDFPCTVRNFTPRKEDPVTQFINDYDIKMAVFDCPAKTWSDLLITVNFTTLGTNATALSDSSSRTVSIVVGLQEDALEVIHNTLPIPLVPDAHLLGGVIRVIREQFKKPGFASLGVFSSTKKYFTSTVPFLMPDPSLQVPRDNNTATLRLYIQDDLSDYQFLVDYRENSVLDGISAVGGFWTAVNGVFATIFGVTMLSVVFGIKPLSTFGLIHKIPKFKPVLEDDPDQGRYRNLLSERQSDQGLLDYIRDHFVDLEPFESSRALIERSNPAATSPVHTG